MKGARPSSEGGSCSEKVKAQTMDSFELPPWNFLPPSSQGMRETLNHAPRVRLAFARASDGQGLGSDVFLRTEEAAQPS